MLIWVNVKRVIFMQEARARKEGYGFAERLIGSIRRECVDHVIVLSHKNNQDRGWGILAAPCYKEAEMPLRYTIVVELADFSVLVKMLRSLRQKGINLVCREFVPDDRKDSIAPVSDE